MQMTQPSSTDATPEEIEPGAANADALLAWLHLLSKAEETEDEPPPYSSPPCYLAEFSDTDVSEQTEK